MCEGGKRESPTPPPPPLSFLPRPHAGAPTHPHPHPHPHSHPHPPPPPPAPLSFSLPVPLPAHGFDGALIPQHPRPHRHQAQQVGGRHGGRVQAGGGGGAVGCEQRREGGGWGRNMGMVEESCFVVWLCLAPPRPLTRPAISPKQRPAQDKAGPGQGVDQLACQFLRRERKGEGEVKVSDETRPAPPSSPPRLISSLSLSPPHTLHLSPCPASPGWRPGRKP